MKYKLIEKNKVLIIAVEGNIGREDKDLLVNCTKEILGKEITLLQHEIRKKKLLVKVVGLTLPMKVLLRGRGVIRSNETFKDIKDVLISLTKVAA